jgi:glycosyltransferase involved in cell wall biosynthesis
MRRGYKVVSGVKRGAFICIMNSFTFDTSKLKGRSKDHHTLFVHRVDGPTVLVRGDDRELDDLVFEVNDSVADVTVFQSFWSLCKTLELGYRPVNPVIIMNSVDPAIFNREGKENFSRDRKVRLISTSWSDNIRKGFKMYSWLDENLDWRRYEYTFVGKLPKGLSLRNIRHIPPVDSRELASILKQHDVYITASENDPCSNALIEALSCGLPALYLDQGGHPEITGYGGLSFSNGDELLKNLEDLVEYYEMFQNLIVVKDISEICDSYLSLADLKEEAFQL